MRWIIRGLPDWHNQPISGQNDQLETAYNVLAQRVRYFKEDKEGTTTMCKAMEELCDMAAAEAAREVQMRIACSLLADGDLSYERIAKNTGLTLEEVIALDNKVPA